MVLCTRWCLPASPHHASPRQRACVRPRRAASSLGRELYVTHLRSSSVLRRKAARGALHERRVHTWFTTACLSRAMQCSHPSWCTPSLTRAHHSPLSLRATNRVLHQVTAAGSASVSSASCSASQRRCSERRCSDVAARAHTCTLLPAAAPVRRRRTCYVVAQSERAAACSQRTASER